MTKHFWIRMRIICTALGFFLLSGSHLGQSLATGRLLELIRGADLDVIEDELPRAAIDAGPPAIPALKAILERSTLEDERNLALFAAVYIGGSEAISLVREVSEKDRMVRQFLPLALASVDTPQSRAELIQMLGPARSNNSVRRLAAKALALLRATEAVSALQAVPRRENDESEDVQQALDWINRGYWPTNSNLSSNSQRIIAGVLRNGVPGLADTDYVFDEFNDGFWRYGAAGWSFTKGKANERDADGPTMKGFVGAEGSLALVSVKISCGRRCSSGYDFVLRREGQNWKVQFFLMTWIT